jgi:hypothetical protein
MKNTTAAKVGLVVSTLFSSKKDSVFWQQGRVAKFMGSCSEVLRSYKILSEARVWLVLFRLMNRLL